MLYTACHQHQLSCRAESDVHAQCPLRVLAHLLYELQRYICILVGHKRLTWSYSAFGNCRGSLVVSMSNAQIRGSARFNRSARRSMEMLPSCKCTKTIV